MMMKQVKIIFENDDGTESLWATPGEKGFVIDNYPLYLKGVCYGDVVKAELIGADTYKYFETIEKSGNSLYRVFYEKEKNQNAGTLLQNAKALGADFEVSELEEGSLVAVHIPEDADADAIWAQIESGINSGVWDVEEGDDRHAS